MDGNNLSLADVATLNNGDSNGLLWLLMIFVLLGWGGAGRGPQPSNLVTQQDMTAGLNNQALQAQTILSNLGRFVAWAGNGAATSGVSST